MAIYIKPRLNYHYIRGTFVLYKSILGTCFANRCSLSIDCLMHSFVHKSPVPTRSMVCFVYQWCVTLHQWHFSYIKCVHYCIIAIQTSTDRWIHSMLRWKTLVIIMIVCMRNLQWNRLKVRNKLCNIYIKLVTLIQNAYAVLSIRAQMKVHYIQYTLSDLT